MPSTSLTIWQLDRMLRLDALDAHCGSLLAGSPNFAITVGVPPALASAGAVSPQLAQESLQSYVLLLSGHFQGFCRDLYSECSQLCVNAVPAGLVAAIQAQCAAEIRLNTGNPTIETIRRDFQRFGSSFDVAHAAPGNPARMTDLGHLNHWRNAIAHQRDAPAPAGIPPSVGLADVQGWRSSCDGLARCLDDMMRQILDRMLGVAPW